MVCLHCPTPIQIPTTTPTLTKWVWNQIVSLCWCRCRYEHLHTILYNPFFIGVAVGQCEHIITLTWDYHLQNLHCYAINAVLPACSKCHLRLPDTLWLLGPVYFTDSGICVCVRETLNFKVIHFCKKHKHKFLTQNKPFLETMRYRILLFFYKSSCEVRLIMKDRASSIFRYGF